MQSEAMSEKRGGGKRTETPSEHWGTVARERRNLPLTAGKSKKKGRGSAERLGLD